MKCSIAGCSGDSRARGLCSKHWQAAKAAGSLPSEWVREQRKPMPMREKLERRREIDPITGCWNWTGRIEDGYGKVALSSRYTSVHKASFELWKGRVPNGTELDHLCRNRRCFNPDHLEPVTHQENVRRGALPQMMREKAAAKTHCYKGHSLSGENLVLQGPQKKFRVCRICRAERQRKRYHETKTLSTTPRNENDC